MTDEQDESSQSLIDHIKDATRGLGASLEHAAGAMGAANDAPFDATTAGNTFGTVPVEGILSDAALVDNAEAEPPP